VKDDGLVTVPEVGLADSEKSCMLKALLVAEVREPLVAFRV
jgi:hypothetical protein